MLVMIMMRMEREEGVLSRLRQSRRFREATARLCCVRVVTMW